MPWTLEIERKNVWLRSPMQDDGLIGFGSGVVSLDPADGMDGRYEVTTGSKEAIRAINCRLMIATTAVDESALHSHPRELLERVRAQKQRTHAAIRRVQGTDHLQASLLIPPARADEVRTHLREIPRYQDLRLTMEADFNGFVHHQSHGVSGLKWDDFWVMGTPILSEQVVFWTAPQGASQRPAI